VFHFLLVVASSYTFKTYKPAAANRWNKKSSAARERKLRFIESACARTRANAKRINLEIFGSPFFKLSRRSAMSTFKGLFDASSGIALEYSTPFARLRPIDIAMRSFAYS
jgi:hypothetical protein